jgi:hypothetical protein
MTRVRLEHAVFRWDGGRGDPGMRPVAYSCEDRVAERVFEAAGRALWGTPDRPTVVRLVRTTNAVLLLRRVPAVDPAGRRSSVTHALIGNDKMLPPLRCVGLAGWDWPGADLPLTEIRGRLDALDLAALAPYGDGRLDELRTEVPGVGSDVAAIVAELLRHPARARLSVLDRSADRDAPILLTGTLDTLQNVLDGPWSFATGDDVPARISFVSEPSHSAVVDSDEGFLDLGMAADDRFAVLSRRLVECSVHDAERYRRLLHELSELPRGVKRLRRLHEELGPAGSSAMESATVEAAAVGAEPSPAGIESPVDPAPTGRPPTGPADARPAGATRAYPELTDARRAELVRMVTETGLGPHRDRPRQLDDLGLLDALSEEMPWTVAEQLLLELLRRKPRTPAAAEVVCCRLLEEGLFVARAAGSAGRWAGLVPEVVETLVRPYLDRPEAHRRTESFVRRVVGAGQTAVLVRLTDMAPLPMSDAAWRALVLAVAADATSARAKTRPGAVTAVLTGPYLRNGVLPAAVVLLVLVAIALIVQ